MNSTDDRRRLPIGCAGPQSNVLAVKACNMLNDSHGMQEIASTRVTVGVNELMVWHGMFLLLMYNH